jgi:hypothetical protein
VIGLDVASACGEHPRHPEDHGRLAFAATDGLLVALDGRLGIALEFGDDGLQQRHTRPGRPALGHFDQMGAGPGQVGVNIISFWA